MYEDLIENRNDLIFCPYNQKHVLKKSRLITHKKICPDRKRLGIVNCPYNKSHGDFSKENLEKHKKICPDRTIINPDLADEMEAFIQNLKKKDGENNTNKIVSKDKANNENKENKYFDRNKNKYNNEIKMKNLNNISKFSFIFDDNMWYEYDSDWDEKNDDCEKSKK